MEKHVFRLTNGPRISKCIFRIRDAEGKMKKGVETTCDFGIMMKYKEKEGILEFALNAKMDEKVFPFSFDVEAQVQLKVEEGLTSEEVKTYGILSGAPYVYATLRNFIADLTRSACLPPYYLPILDVDEISKIEVPEEKLKAIN